MELDDPLRGEPAEPGIKRQGSVAEVAIELLAGVSQSLLDYIRRVNERRQPPVETDDDHAAATDRGAAPSRS